MAERVDAYRGLNGELYHSETVAIAADFEWKVAEISGRAFELDEMTAELIAENAATFSELLEPLVDRGPEPDNYDVYCSPDNYASEVNPVDEALAVGENARLQKQYGEERELSRTALKDISRLEKENALLLEKLVHAKDKFRLISVQDHRSGDGTHKVGPHKIAHNQKTIALVEAEELEEFLNGDN